MIFESVFIQVALQQLEEEKSKDSYTQSLSVETTLTASGSQQKVPVRRSRASTSNATNLGTSPELSEGGLTQSASSTNMDRIRRAVSISSLNSLSKTYLRL